MDSGIEQLLDKSEDGNDFNYFRGNEKIETVVITGAMGIKRTKDAVVSASYKIMSNNELSQSTNPNAIQALSGRVSGLQITGEGNNQKIVLRGSRSVTGDNKALVVIDGVVSSAAVLTQLPAEIIDSITVLNGAEAGTLYGAQGVNGVIIVTTKKAIQELTNVKTRKTLMKQPFSIQILKPIIMENLY